jgi:asparaginyl-tRNA synthetase
VRAKQLTQSDLPNLYIDEKAGSDETGTGAELAPFASALAAYQSLSPEASSDATPSAVANFLFRKADSVERNEWVEISGAGKKKLVKNIDGWRKKEAKKVADGAKMEKERKEMEERDAKKREEAKGVVLVNDQSQEATKASDL